MKFVHPISSKSTAVYHPLVLSFHSGVTCIVLPFRTSRPYCLYRGLTIATIIIKGPATELEKLVLQRGRIVVFPVLWWMQMLCDCFVPHWCINCLKVSTPATLCGEYLAPEKPFIGIWNESRGWAKITMARLIWLTTHNYNAIQKVVGCVFQPNLPLIL